MSRSQKKNSIYQLVVALVLLVVAAALDQSANKSFIVSGITALLNIGGITLVAVSIYKLVKSRNKKPTV